MIHNIMSLYLCKCLQSKYTCIFIFVLLTVTCFLLVELRSNYANNTLYNLLYL